jgi:spore germination cell wall hydrolase CwlJ-like protein
MLAMPVLLFAASCVPAADAGTAGARFASLTPGAAAAAAQQPAPPATEEPPPPEILAKEIAVGDPARPFDIGPASQGDVQSALECLTAAIYYEARSESDDGERAVAQVVLNRVRHPAFPKTVCGVVYQGSNRSTGCQFTFTCDGSLARGARQPYAWARAQKIAAAALAGYVFSPVGLATHYHTTAIHPWWADSMARAVTIGAHIFYRWNGAWGDPRSFRRPYVGAEAMAQNAGAWGSGTDGAADPNVQIVSGVSIHRGTEPALTLASADDGSTVRIHRAGLHFAAAAPAAPAPAAASASDGMDGVRIHRAGSEEAPASAPEASAPVR